MYGGDKERVETGEHGIKMQRHCKTDICELFIEEYIHQIEVKGQVAITISSFIEECVLYDKRRKDCLPVSNCTNQ